MEESTTAILNILNKDNVLPLTGTEKFVSSTSNEPETSHKKTRKRKFNGTRLQKLKARMYKDPSYQAERKALKEAATLQIKVKIPRVRKKPKQTLKYLTGFRYKKQQRLWEQRIAKVNIQPISTIVEGATDLDNFTCSELGKLIENKFASVTADDPIRSTHLFQRLPNSIQDVVWFLNSLTATNEDELNVSNVEINTTDGLDSIKSKSLGMKALGRANTNQQKTKQFSSTRIFKTKVNVNNKYKAKDDVMNEPKWSLKQLKIISAFGLKSIASLDMEKEDLKKSNILFEENDEHAEKNLNEMIQLADSDLLLSVCTDEKNHLIPSEGIIWSPRSLEKHLIHLTADTNYIPNRYNLKSCCNCKIECELESCSCKLMFMECWHERQCANTVIHDGIFPITYLSTKTYLTSLDKSLITLGVRTLQPIRKNEIVGVYAGEIKCVNGSNLEYSVYALDISKFFKNLGKNEQIIIDGIPYGNCMTFVNGQRQLGIKANVECVVYKTCNTTIPVLQAVKDIDEMEFIYCDQNI